MAVYKTLDWRFTKGAFHQSGAANLKHSSILPSLWLSTKLEGHILLSCRHFGCPPLWLITNRAPCTKKKN